MNKLTFSVLMFIVLFFISFNSYSQDGEKMERSLFQAVKDKDWTTLEGLIANGFQSMHQDGPKSRNTAIDYIKSITFKYYHFSDVTATTNEAGNIVVISYKLSFSENLEMTEKEKGMYVNNISVWTNSAGKWQWMSHSVFDANVSK